MKFVILIASFATLACVGLAAEAPAAGEVATSPERTGPPQCFTCNSYVDPECGDDFDGDNHNLAKVFLKTCPQEATYCKKVKMWFNLNGETRIMRGCGIEKREYKQPCYQSRADDHIVDTCQCDDDRCNSGPFSASPALFAVIGAGAVALRL